MKTISGKKARRTIEKEGCLHDCIVQGDLDLLNFPDKVKLEYIVIRGDLKAQRAGLYLHFCEITGKTYLE